MASVSDENRIYVFQGNKLYYINRETLQPALLYEGGKFNGIGMYEDWLYCVENSTDSNVSENSLIKISKDGKGKDC